MTSLGACPFARAAPRREHRRSRTHRRAVACAAAAPPAWRLAGEGGVAPAFLELARAIEAQWCTHAGASPLSPLAVDARFVHADGGEAAERLRIENRFYATPLFRKCHLELAAGAGGLSVLHCVMFPFAEQDLPLFAIDMVGFGPRVTLAICDVCPSREDLSLPPGYEGAGELASLMKGLQLRGIPDWGRKIFSAHCMCVSPQAEADVATFSRYTQALLRLHLDAAAAAASRPRRSDAAVAATAAAHARFCACQLENDKTRRILAKAFGAAYADDYMDEVLFDCAARPTVPLRAAP